MKENYLFVSHVEISQTTFFENLEVFLVLLESPWQGLNEGDLEIFRLEVQKILNSFCHWNLIKLPKLVSEGKISSVTSLNLGLT